MKKVLVFLLMCPVVAFAGGEAPPASFMNTETISLIFGALWIFSEALAQIPAVKGNSIFQLIASILEKIGQPKGKIEG
jgi:hypothetical protein